jgi:hypothetical protein
VRVLAAGLHMAGQPATPVTPTMSNPDLTSPGPTSGLQAAVRQQTWAWLVAICRPMNVSAEIVDVRGDLCCPVVTGPATLVVRRLMTEDDSSLLETVTASISANAIESISVNRLNIVSVPLSLAGPPVGALVLAHDPFQISEADADPGQLAETGGWLGRAVEAHLVADHLAAPDPCSRLASVHGAVHAAAERGSDRDVALAFSEALAVYDGVEIRGYAEDVPGQFILSVESGSGVDPDAPKTLDPDLAPAGPGLTRLSREAAGRAGVQRDRDAFIARIDGAVPRPWIILLVGAAGARTESLLSLYLDLLRQAMSSAERMGEATLLRQLSDSLLGAVDAADASGALEEVSRAFDAVASVLVVMAGDGARLLTVGDAHILTSARPRGAMDQITATAKVDEQTAVIAVRRPDGDPFTMHDQRLLQGVTRLFASWLPTVLRRLPTGRDRQVVNREFEQLLEHTAARALDDGAEVSALVIDAGGAPLPPDWLSGVAAEIRGRLRASDLTGMLSECEVGVLLPGAGPVGAVAVGTRIQELLESGDRSGPAPAIGVATRAPGSAAGSLLESARADAIRREEST